MIIYTSVSIQEIRRLENLFAFPSVDGNTLVWELPHWLQILSHVAFVRLQQTYKNEPNKPVTIL